MTDTSAAPPGPESGPKRDQGAAPGPAKAPSRAGRNLPLAITSGVLLVAAVVLTLAFWKLAFIFLVAAAVVIALWEMARAMTTRGIDIPQEPLMLGGVVMLFVAYLFGAPALVTATAVTVLATMLWLLRRGVAGYVQNVSASVFTLIYVPFLASFVALLLSEDEGVKGVLAFIAVTVASDIGGYVAGVLFGKHPMAPVISPKKSWEGFAGSALACVVVGYLVVVPLLDGDWWVGVILGLLAVVGATLGDLCESVIKRDLGIKDMSQVIPGHGGMMDRLDSLLATVAPIWLVLHYLVF
ncbi:MAG: phosphatidate cytidylyltransferase [Marmoricola sp.]|nr:phosphatidate cytidylyltransferase [Marmoricola sp.]